MFAIEDSLNGLLSAIKSNIQNVIVYKNKYNQKNIKNLEKIKHCILDLKLYSQSAQREYFQFYMMQNV